MLNQELKQRLIGAAVLLGVGILVIPSLLGWPPETAYENAHESERASSGLVGTSLAKSDGLLYQQEKSRLASAAVVPEQAKSDLFSSAESDANNVSLPPPPAPASSSPQTSGKASRWVIQIGSFARQENALGMRDRAVSLGYHAFIETVQKGTQTIYKVRIHPERDVGHVKELKQALDRRLHTNAFLISPRND